MKHSFKEAYDVLQKHAATLRDQSEPNIDDLLHIVEESVAAYKTCQSRIDAVEKALEKALGQVEEGHDKGTPDRGRGAESGRGNDTNDSDIPF